MEALLWETVRLVGGGFKGIIFSPSSREWWGWLLAFTVIGLWHYRSSNLDRVFPRSTYLSASFVHDLLSIGLKLFFFRVVLRLLLGVEMSENAISASTSGALLGIFPAAREGALRTGIAVNALYSLGLFLAFEFGWYAAHWATHKVPLLWAFHKVHHTTTLMNPLASKRVHVLDEILLVVSIGTASGLVLFAFNVLGYAPSLVMVFTEIPLFTLAFLATGALRHSHIPVSYGRLDHYFTSPFMHQVHHSCRPEHVNKNYGYYLTLFDRLFGTLYVPREGEELVFGVSESAVKAPPQGFVRMYFLQPFLDVRDYYRANRLFAFPKRP